MLSGIRAAVVAGGTGFIGSALVRRLSSEGVRTVCLLRRHSQRRKQIEYLPDVELLEMSGPADDWGQRLARIKPDVIFNLASAGVNPEERDPQQLLLGNIGIAAELIGAAQAAPPKKFLHVGSCAEYGPTEAGQILSEEHPLVPQSVYGAAKLCAHIYGSTLCAHRKIPFTTLRFFGVFGPGEGAYRLIPYVIDHLRRNEQVDLTGGEQVRDYIYVDDAIEALLLAAQCERLQSGSAYNVCSGKAIKIRYLAECVASALGKSQALLCFGQRAYRDDEPMWIVGDNRRFAASTGWSPKIGLSKGIEYMIGELHGNL